jgi:hypothetical protein
MGLAQRSRQAGSFAAGLFFHNAVIADGNSMRPGVAIMSSKHSWWHKWFGNARRLAGYSPGLFPDEFEKGITRFANLDFDVSS